MTHTDPDIAEMLERFRNEFVIGSPDSINYWRKTPYPIDFEAFIARECLALKKKWEREHFDNQ